MDDPGLRKGPQPCPGGQAVAGVLEAPGLAGLETGQSHAERQPPWGQNGRILPALAEPREIHAAGLQDGVQLHHIGPLVLIEVDPLAYAQRLQLSGEQASA